MSRLSSFDHSEAPMAFFALKNILRSGKLNSARGRKDSTCCRCGGRDSISAGDRQLHRGLCQLAPQRKKSHLQLGQCLSRYDLLVVPSVAFPDGLPGMNPAAAAMRVNAATDDSRARRARTLFGPKRRA